MYFFFISSAANVALLLDYYYFHIIRIFFFFITHLLIYFALFVNSNSLRFCTRLTNLVPFHKMIVWAYVCVLKRINLFFIIVFLTFPPVLINSDFQVILVSKCPEKNRFIAHLKATHWLHQMHCAWSFEVTWMHTILCRSSVLLFFLFLSLTLSI